MKKVIKHVCFLTALLFAGITHALPSWSTSAGLTIDELRTHGSNYIYAQITSGAGTMPCTSSALVIIPSTSSAQQRWNDKTFSILLTAAATGATLRLYVESCNSAGHAVISGARLINP